MPSKLEELERLATLRDRGVLTDDEFNAEKSRLLDAHPAAPGPVRPAVSSLATEAGRPVTPRERRTAFRAYERRLWSFGPITERDDAAALLAAGWFACWLTVTNEFLEYLGNIWTAVQGLVIDPAMPNDEALGYYFVPPFFWSIILIAAAWIAVKRQSRVAAGFLIVLATLEFLGSLAVRWDGDKTLRNASFFICIPAIIMAVQCFRAARAYRALSRS